jgi:hypothetical protein
LPLQIEFDARGSGDVRSGKVGSDERPSRRANPFISLTVLPNLIIATRSPTRLRHTLSRLATRTIEQSRLGCIYRAQVENCSDKYAVILPEVAVTFGDLDPGEPSNRHSESSCSAIKFRGVSGSSSKQSRTWYQQNVVDRYASDEARDLPPTN